MSERNNEQRLAVDQSVSVSAEKKQEVKQDPLSFLSPTHIVELPSKGKFYSVGHPLHNKESIEIRFMTAKEEDILTSKALLKKGVALDRMIESLLVDKSINIDDLFLGDKNAIIVAARVTGYGAEYETKVQCPSCGATVKHSFDLNNLKHSHISEDCEKQLLEKGTFTVQLPLSKLSVEVRPLKGIDEKALTRMAEERKALGKTGDSMITDQLRAFIASINDVKDRVTINRFVDICPAGDSRVLRNKYSEISPNIDLKQKFVCKSCDSEMEMEVPFTVDFFWSGR